mgnify:CR=1 FL=1|tara:strand:+ start:2168 stop:2866 length:699 start_codon:yes stop_codon:yes gene_type:complete
MDQLITTDKLEILTPLLMGITYLSAFKNRKPTCDRYIINYFLYLLTSLSIFLYSGEKLKEYFKGNFIAPLLITVPLIIMLAFTKNIWLRHLLWILILIFTGIVSSKIYERYGEEEIKSAFVKLMFIILFCMLITTLFPQYIKSNFEIVIILALLIVVILRVIDSFIYQRKTKMLIQITIFLLALLMIYDINRVSKNAKLCMGNKIIPDYIDTVSDMFLNLRAIFGDLLRIEE